MAHRPENTMTAFRLALECGAYGIETDVHQTKDGYLVLIHDETLERTTNGTGRVGEHTLAELRAYDAGVRFGVEEMIPTLDELLNFAEGQDVVLNLEVKTDVERYDGIEERLLQTLKEHAFDPKWLILSSFNHETIHRLKQLAPSIEGALLLAQPLFDVESYMKKVGADSLHPHVDALTDADIVRLQARGIAIRPYTVKKRRQLHRFERLGVEAVFVNDITWARSNLTP